MAQYREGLGLPPVRLSERGRQLLAFLATLLGLTAGQLGLLLCCAPLAGRGPSVDHQPLLAYWPDGATVGLVGGATVLPLGGAIGEQTAIGVSAVLSSALGVLVAVLSRSHNRVRRRRALLFGYVYILAELGTASLIAVRATRGPKQGGTRCLERHYHTAFANAMWDYLYDPALKLYIDTVQQELRCCGAGGFADWYLTDWLRPSTYKQRYYMGLLGRLRAGMAPNESYYALRNYGSARAQRALVAQLDDPEATSRKRCELFFNEAPFSCCDPEAPTFCRQLFANRAMFAYDPAANLTLFDRGCARAVATATAADSRAAVAPLWWLFGVKLAALALYRLVQSSQAGALAAGRHLSPARGWLVLLRPGRGGPPQQPLLGDTDDMAADSDGASTNEGGDASTGETDGTSRDVTADSDDGDVTSDNIPPPPPMD